MLMTGLFSRLIRLALVVTILDAAPLAANNVLRWASIGGALTIDPHAYNEVPTNAQTSQVYREAARF
jgi:hypothetical protein